MRGMNLLPSVDGADERTLAAEGFSANHDNSGRLRRC